MRNAAKYYETCSNTAADFLTGSLLQWGTDSYLPEDPGSSSETYTSPLHHPFEASIPLCICAGTEESFCEPIKMFAGEMGRAQGNCVRFYAARKAPHDVLMSHATFGMTEKFRATVDGTHTFLSGEKLALYSCQPMQRLV